MSFKRAQTSTEYLIILAVVIVIALIVVGVLGGIPSIGSGASKQTSDLELSNQKVGISKYGITAGSTVLLVKNNHYENVKVNNITFGGIVCNSAVIPFTLKVGETKKINCTNINSTNMPADVTPALDLNWTDRQTGALFSINVTGYGSS